MFCRWFASLVLVLGLPIASEAAQPERLQIRIENVTIRVGLRTADQINAFYEARGFPSAALKTLSTHCFIGIFIRNESKHVVWLERTGFRFRGPGANDEWLATPLAVWLERWQGFELPAAARAAFRWTQLPEKRDLQPNEPVGGNLSFPRRNGSFDLEIALATGADGRGPPLRTRFAGLRCP